MAVTQTSVIQPAYHRELVTFTDSFGCSNQLYIYANQIANRDTLIAAELATMQANETSMTALVTAATPPPPTP